MWLHYLQSSWFSQKVGNLWGFPTLSPWLCIPSCVSNCMISGFALHPAPPQLLPEDSRPESDHHYINPSEVGWGWQIKGRSEGYSLYNHLLVHLSLSHFGPWDPKVHLAGVGLFCLHSDCLQQSQVKNNKAPTITSPVKGTCIFVHIPVHTMTTGCLLMDV